MLFFHCRLRIHLLGATPWPPRPGLQHARELTQTSSAPLLAPADARQEQRDEPPPPAAPSPEARVLLAQGLLQLGKAQEAMAELDSLIRQHPGCARGEPPLCILQASHDPPVLACLAWPAS
jgi:predicted Zn-dependent protease